MCYILNHLWVELVRDHIKIFHQNAEKYCILFQLKCFFFLYIFIIYKYQEAKRRSWKPFPLLYELFA